MKRSTYLATALAAALPLLVCGAAHAADTGATVEIGYNDANLSNPKVDFSTIEFRGGYQFTKHFGVELEGGPGVGTQTITDSGVRLDIKEQWETGLYGVGYLPVGHNADVLVRAGYSRTQAQVSAGSTSLTGQDNGAAVGVGFRQFPGGGKNGWRVDYTHYFYNGDAVNTFGVAYVRRF